MQENDVQINGGIMINVDMSVKNVMYSKKYVWNPPICSIENEKYLASIMDYSVIICDEIIDAEAQSKDKETKTVSTNFNEKKNIIRKMESFNILSAFLFATIALLIAVTIYCYQIQCRAKQNHLLPFYFINNELKEIIY